MFYKLCCDSKYEETFKVFVKRIREPCSKSEFQFLDKSPLNWKIQDDCELAFESIFYIQQKVLVISKNIWEKALSIVDTDGIFQIPLVINYCGEQHRYVIVVPTRINCLNKKGKILSENVGRYHIFKSKVEEDNSIYISEQLMIELKEFTTLNFKGVD